MSHRFDLLVVGGGIAGTMAVLAAAARNLDVLWVADAVGPEDQSAHWHGHLHRGRLYDPVRERDLIEELGRNAAFWWSEPVVPFHTDITTIAVGPDTAWADEFQKRIEVAARGIVPPRFLRDDVVAVRTDEAILDGPRFLSVAQERARAASTAVLGRAGSLRADGAEWRADVLATSGEARVVRARAVIIAGGTANGALLPAGVRLDRALDVRMSRMLVLRGDLPRVAAIVPSRASGGLFFASREVEPDSGADRKRVWLVSDGFSSRGDIDRGDLTSAWWTCSVLERLAEFVDPDLLHGAEVGAYLAPKSRLESSPTHVPADGMAADPSRRFVALTPAKWSATPTSAVAAVAALFPDAVQPVDRIRSLSESLRDVAVPAHGGFAESWTHVRSWVPLRELREPGVRALAAAADLYRSDSAREVSAYPHTDAVA